jgi:hypothetical protein
MDMGHHDQGTAEPPTARRVWAPADIIAFAGNLPGVVAVTASEAGGAPEVAWGDTFLYYDPDGDGRTDRRMPFATIVTKDYDGFDTASRLNRPGVFRLNIAVGRAVFEELIGHPPAAHAAHADHAAHAAQAEMSDRYDYSAVDRLLPHPVYAVQAWVAIVNPGEQTADQARTLLAAAHARAARPRRPGKPIP